MHFRDLVIVAVAIICCIIVWSQEGALNFRCGFKIPLTEDTMSSNSILKPLLIEFRERGKRFLLTSSSEMHLGLFETTHTRFAERHFILPLRPILTIPFDSSIIAFASGFLNENAPLPIVCVLTRNYELTAIELNDKDYRILWKTTVLPADRWDFGYHVAISVVPERVYDGDVGMVTIAIKVIDPNKAAFTRFSAFNGRNGEVRWGFFSDEGAETDDVLHEANDTLPLTSAEKGDILNIDLPNKKDTSSIEHRAYHSSQRQGFSYEKPWTTFREAVIVALPHHYAHPWDVELTPHTIYSAKHTQPTRASKRVKRQTFTYQNHIIRLNEEDYGILGAKIAQWKEKHLQARDLPHRVTAKGEAQPRSRVKPENALVYHGKNGMVVLHMYTGNVITTVSPLKAYNVYYHDIDDDFHIESITTQIGPRVSTYAHHGVDILDDCLGIVYTNLPSAEDEMFNTTICDTQGFFGNLDLIHRFVDGDTQGEGVPRVLNTLELLGSRNIVSKSTFSVMPLVVQVHRSRFLGLLQVERYAVFMINSGLITCVDPSRRRVLWRVQTPSSFSGPPHEYSGKRPLSNSDDALPPRLFPHLAAYTLYEKHTNEKIKEGGGGGQPYRRADSHVLAVGKDTLTAINSKTGVITCRIALEEPPIAPVLVLDFNGDTINDLIIVSKGHIYGFIGSTQASSETLPVLMMLMICLLAVLFFSRRVFEFSEETEYRLPTSTHEKAESTKELKYAKD
ncbi:unnamed protein product [Phytomonas sp. Hart1]|nr:unnamed protein product [Phytomonas sp. Hart1]|eukprot:CCW67757.1 unnamed protein product [Phytomonas sp. isolate Hart1]